MVMTRNRTVPHAAAVVVALLCLSCLHRVGVHALLTASAPTVSQVSYMTAGNELEIGDSAPISTTMPAATLPTQATAQVFRIDRGANDVAGHRADISVGVSPPQAIEHIRVFAKYGSAPTVTEYDAQAQTGYAMFADATTAYTSLRLKPSCYESALNAVSLFVTVINFNELDTEVTVSSSWHASSIELTSPDATNTTSVSGDLCCGASDRYDLGFVRPPHLATRNAVVRVRLQNNAVPLPGAPSLGLYARRSTCASQTHFDATAIVAPGQSHDLMLEDNPTKGRWQVTVASIVQFGAQSAETPYTLTSSVFSVGADPSGANDSGQSLYTSLMALRHRDDGENTDTRLLGTSVWVWIALATLFGIILGGVGGIASWAHLKDNSKRESDYVALQLPSHAQRAGGLGGSAGATPVKQGIIGAGAQPTSGASSAKSKSRVTFEDGGSDHASPSSMRRLDTELLSDIEEGNHQEEIQRSITIIDSYHRTKSTTYEGEERAGNGENDADEAGDVDELTEGPHDLVYSADLSGPSGQLSLRHGKNEVGRGVAGVTCKKVSRTQIMLVFNAETGGVSMTTLGKNPSALRRGGDRALDEEGGVSRERGAEPTRSAKGWKLLPAATAETAAVTAKLHDSDEIALCLPSRVPGEHVTFCLTLNKL